MGRTIQSVPIAKLLLDTSNPRLGDAQESQHDTMLELARRQGKHMIALAKDIVEQGDMDPLNLLAVVATGGTSRRYRVLEGNRRTLALKALETPSIVLSVLESNDRKTLSRLSTRYHENPLDEVTCVLFDTEDEAQHWIRLRHTGLNQGAGLSEWDSDEKDRWDARHGGGSRTFGGQVLDLVREIDGPEPAGTPRVAITTLTRLLTSPAVRDKLGLVRKNGQLMSHYPRDQVIKGLRRMLADVRSTDFKVGDVYTAEQREAYAAGLQSEDLPDPATRLADDYTFEELPATSTVEPEPPTPRPKPKRKPRPAPPRTTIIPGSCTFSPTPPRINAIFVELSTLDINTYPNSGGVALRVFIELTVDHHIVTHSLMSEQDRRNKPLGARLKTVAEHLHARDEIPKQMLQMVQRVAESGTSPIAASMTTFNQFVHNAFVHPRANELMTTWDELEPFLAKVWA